MGSGKQRWERRRYVGDAEVRISFDERKDSYSGEVHVAGKKIWAFEGVGLGGGLRLAVDAPEAWDRAAVAACVFGTWARGDGYPSREDARTIEYALLAAIDGSSNENKYLVRRSQNRGPSYGPYA